MSKFAACILDQYDISKLVNCIRPSDQYTANDKWVFFAYKGKSFNSHTLIDKAISMGVLFVVSDNLKYTNDRVQVYHSDNILLDLAIAAKKIYNKSPEHVIAITGSNGKTSSSYVLWNNMFHSMNYRIAYLGTSGILPREASDLVWNLEHSSNLYNTTPDHCSLYKGLNNLSEQDYTHVIVETSSCALLDHRAEFIAPKYAVYTNISRDHIDFHGSMREYVNSKKRLFDTVMHEDGYAIINIEDQYAKEIIQSAKGKVFTYGVSYLNKIKTVPDIDIIDFIEAQELIVMRVGAQEYNLKVKNVISPIQLYNAAIYASLCYCMGCWDDFYNSGHALDLHTPGRLNAFPFNNNSLAVVDHAHNVGGVYKILALFRNMRKYDKIIAVFGAGVKDISRRRLVGRILYSLADEVIITDDNYGDQDPAMIRKDIINIAIDMHEIPGRVEGISYAISNAGDNALVLVLGRGDEQEICIANGKVLSLTDADIVKFCIEVSK